MKFSPNIGKLVFRLYMALIALLVVGVVVLIAPLFTCGDALLAVLRGDLDAALVCSAEDDQWLVSRSLLNAGANPNATRDDGSSLLSVMIVKGNTPMVRLLLSKGADPSAADGRGRTALELARELQRTELIGLLESYTAGESAESAETAETAGSASSAAADGACGASEAAGGGADTVQKEAALPDDVTGARLP